MKKRALITGIGGMDGSYLADFLLSKGYEVYGLKKRAHTDENTNIKHIKDKIHIISGNMLNKASLVHAVEESQPGEIYNFAAQSSVGKSWNIPEYTHHVNGLATLNFLEVIKDSHKSIKFFQAGSSEMFGDATQELINEDSPFRPTSPYAISKLFAYWTTKIYRQSHNMFNVNGILFNHESERRGLGFVTRKITRGVARIKLGLTGHITLGNLDIERDWGYAPDYVEAMWLMMQQDQPDDYIVATGTSHSLRDFLDIAFKHIDIKNWEQYIRQDPKYMRPADIRVLRGDSTKARTKLNWQPQVSFEEMIKKMIDNDLNLLEENANLNN